MRNFNYFTLMVIVCHIIGDFQFQSQELSDGKTRNRSLLLRHILIHGILLIYPLVLGIVFKEGIKALISIAIIIFLHYLFDFLKITFGKDEKIGRIMGNDAYLFLLDQILHLGLIVLLGEVIFKSELGRIKTLLVPKGYILYLLTLIIVTKPANVLFKIAFSRFGLGKKEDSKKDDGTFDTDANMESEAGAGALIGNLERVLSIIFLSMGQSSAIGLIYTAKSIARFKQIEENKRFAEYYLIGTLYSILYAISTYFIVLK